MSIIINGSFYGYIDGILNGTFDGEQFNGRINKFGTMNGQFVGHAKGNVNGYVSGYVFMYGTIRGNASNISGTVNPLPEANQIVYGQPSSVFNIITYLNGYATLDCDVNGYLYNVDEITVQNIF